MNPHQISDRHVTYAQLICFAIAIIAVLGNVAFPNQHISHKIIQTAFATGSILLAMKLAREGWDMAAAGFTIFGIAWGILFAGVDFWYEKPGMHIISSAGYFFFPAFILISFYKPFPKWIKIATLWCAFPYTINLILFNMNHNHNVLGIWAEIGFMSFHIVSLCWSVYFFKQYKKSIAVNEIKIEE
ncbi:MAG: hypothetical protein IPM92_15205 [Saprospiraceae bacterium]|nr:hypothetical protein [Saprospiraceae bacterium]